MRRADDQHELILHAGRQARLGRARPAVADQPEVELARAHQRLDLLGVARAAGSPRSRGIAAGRRRGPRGARRSPGWCWPRWPAYPAATPGDRRWRAGRRVSVANSRVAWSSRTPAGLRQVDGAAEAVEEAGAQLRSRAPGRAARGPAGSGGAPRRPDGSSRPGRRPGRPRTAAASWFGFPLSIRSEHPIGPYRISRPESDKGGPPPAVRRGRR